MTLFMGVLLLTVISAIGPLLSIAYIFLDNI